MRVDLLEQYCFFHKQVSHNYQTLIEMAESSGYIPLKARSL